VGLTLFGQANPTLEGFLHDKQAVVRPVLSYVYAPAADDDRVADLIERLAAGAIDVLVFTSSPQVDRLYDVAQKRGMNEKLSAGVQRVKVAAVGPVVAEALRARGAPVHVCPEQGWVMKNLVRRLVREMGSSGD
jgi:uroporphyrinogen-III synthase